MDTSAPPVKRWRLLPHDRHAVEALTRSLRVPPLVAQLLLNRGLYHPEEAQRFLDCPLSGLHPPQRLPGIDEAVDRLLAAIADNRPICVYGDYDVDGVTGSSILMGILQLLGARPQLHIPHRLEEGYGLNAETLRQLASQGIRVVVTVDCGIASVAEALEARRLGIELIITDHHEMKETLPEAAVLVHPRLPGSSYPFGQLCGAGVALKLAWALAQKKCGGEKVSTQYREFLLDAVAFAALGVVADVVPLTDENRILVRYGLSRLRTKPPLGVDVLREVAGVSQDDMRASDIGFKLAPRINAAGRLGMARLAVDLLMATGRERAVDLARHLDSLNEMRQKLERETVARAKELIASQNLGDAPALVLADADWHGGIVGIVAGRLAESYGRPALIITMPSGDSGLHAKLAVGSGRSFGGLALHEALAACTDLLVGHGGHAAAAGFRLEADKVDAFRERFCEVVSRHFPEGPPTPELVLDAEAPLGSLTLRVLDDIDRLEPYGAENRKPLFLLSGLKVDGEPRVVGKSSTHLQFRVRQNGITMKAIGWGMASRLDELMSAGGECSLVVTLKRNEWQGRVSVDLEVMDLQPRFDPELS
jgi:single-stranded-DNA-specific exonuclease